ncbi:MAG TPA: alpha/beta hydrolase [Pedobacter sp.]|jgi:pimeloyl-ACP methyl ester carboxylesterase
MLHFLIYRFPVILAFCYLYSSNSLAQTQGSAVPLKDLYENAKVAYAEYERKHGGFVNTRNTRLHYLSWGSPNKPAFLWVHGSLTNAYEFKGFADTLVQQGYRVIAIDYYGHGKTPIPKHPVSLYHIADDIRDLMVELRIKKAVIGGWSRGGAVSTAFYDAYPERVRGLILEDGGSVSINTDYHLMDDPKLNSTVKSIVDSFPKDTSYVSEFDAYTAIYDSGSGGNQFENLAWITRTEKGRYAICPGVADLFNMKSENGWLNNIVRPTRSPLFAQSFSVLEPKIVYRNLKVPMLILDPVSSDDFMKFEKANAELEALHPHLIEHKIYKDTGHNIHYEKRKEFTGDLINFLKRVR